MFSVVLTVFEMIWESRFQYFFFFFSKTEQYLCFLKSHGCCDACITDLFSSSNHIVNMHMNTHTLSSWSQYLANCQKYENQHLIFSSAQMNLNLYSSTSQCKHWNPIEKQLRMNFLHVFYYKTYDVYIILESYFDFSLLSFLYQFSRMATL